MKIPKSVNKLTKHLDAQLELLCYYMNSTPSKSEYLADIKAKNAKIADILEAATLDKKIDHARFLNKIKNLDILTKKIPLLRRIHIATLFILGKIEKDRIVK